MTFGHLCVLGAWIVGSLIIATEAIPGKPTKHKATWIAVLALVMFIFDVWASHFKKQRESSAAPPSQQSPSQAVQSSASTPIQSQEHKKPQAGHAEPQVPTPKYIPPKGPQSSAEVQRRAVLLDRLQNEYLLSHDGITPAEMARTEVTPREAEWINVRLKEKRELWRVSPTTKPSTPTPVIIQTAPTFGNIKERAVALSQEIMSDLYRNGWPPGPGQQISPGFVIQQMPTTGNELSRWIKNRSGYFRWRFFERVLDIRNEFAQLHLRDERLDDFFKYQGMIEQANKQMAAIDPQRQIDTPLLPQQVEEVAERLRVLAEQIK